MACGRPTGVHPFRPFADVDCATEGRWIRSKWSGPLVHPRTIARHCVCVYICKMRTLSDFRNIPDEFRGSTVAIGNFDGVHLGHLQVINRVKDSAAARGAKPAVVTFEPHPRQHFAPNAPPFRLMNTEAKARRLETIGVELMFELPFDDSLAGLGAVEFSREVLAEGLGIRCAVVGEDFRFGKGRLGDAQQLTEHGSEFGFDTSIVPIAGGDRRRRRDSRTLAQDRRTGAFRGAPRSNPWFSDGQHFTGEPASAKIWGLCRLRRCADRRAQGTLRRIGFNRSSANVRREHGQP